MPSTAVRERRRSSVHLIIPPNARAHSHATNAIPLFVCAMAMAAMGGWVWATPALIYAGLEYFKGPTDADDGGHQLSIPHPLTGHVRRLSASGRARRASSGNVAELVEKIRSRSASSRVCCICLDSIADNEPLSDLFECKHDAQTHKECINKWLEKHETCPLCRRDVKDPIIDQMKNQPMNAEAQLKGCRFIVLKGWQNEDYQRHFVDVRAADLVIRAMVNHSDNHELIAACCAAIFVLAFASKEVQDHLASLGACELVVKAMTTFAEDVEVQSRGCGAIYSLSLSNKDTQQRLSECLAHAAVLNALHRFMGNTSVAISAADAIMSLACDNQVGQDLLGTGGDATPELNGKGACELLGELVDGYATERDVMYAALDAVMKLAIDNPDNRLRFGACGMCKKVMDSFARYEDDELFLLVALTAVYTMAENQKENQSRLLEGDGAKILLKTLKKHEDFQDIISVGLDVIFALTYDSHDGPSTLSHPILREAGSCEFILKMLEDYPRCPEIYGPGLKAMACLLTSAENQATMTGPAWCRVVTESMTHALEARDIPVLEICCRVVGNLALHSSDNQAVLREGDVCRMVCECLRRGFSKWEALEATADLAYNCPENREEFGQHDAIHLVVKSIERNLEDPVTLDIACMALTNLVQDSPENASRLEGQTLRIRGRDRRISIYALLTTILPDKTVRGERSCIIMMALSILCANNSEAQTQAGNAGACQIVVDKIRSEIHDGTVVRQGIQLLSDLAVCHAPNQDRVRVARGLELLIELLPDFSDDVLDAARWLTAISMIAEANTLNQNRLIELEVPEAAIKLQQAFPEDDALIDAALGALANMAANNRRNQDYIGEIGTCELVCQVAEKAASNPHFLTRCCSVILALSELERLDEEGQPLHIWKDTSYNNKVRLRKCGAAKVFSEAIIRNATTSEPLILGGLILSLALIAEDDAQTTTLLRENGIFTLILELVRNYPTHDTLMTAAGGFIATSSVIFNDDWTDFSRFQTPVTDNQNLFLEGGAVPVLIQAMKRLPDDKGAVIMGFIALAAVAWQNPDGIQEIVEHVDLIDKLLVHDSNKGPECIFYGLLLLGALVSLPVNGVRIRCRPLIVRWSHKAAELYPSSNCLTRFRTLLMEHIRKDMDSPPTFVTDAA